MVDAWWKKGKKAEGKRKGEREIEKRGRKKKLEDVSVMKLGVLY